ncbi:hypothetical protein [Nocardiopsis metallicus]|uniref:Uncharacterized protein n=1 Tax=Nocardiopsis metallicus TaxID=179819 RepID=A0A840WP64_9ACTN|nr:hypothetical protein [Nocardiopsis metallicus]MBB5493595.1 hypothetical protein [Nocardiopsis metallicus]
MSQVSARPEEAHSVGRSSESAAAQLHDLPEDFRDIQERCKSATSKDPGLDTWDSFGNKYIEYMNSIKEQADIISGNIQSSAEDISSTEDQAVDTFDGVNVPI